MTRRRARAAGALALMAAVGLLGVLLASPQRQARSSVLSAHSAGWLAARRYLEERGDSVELAARPLDETAETTPPPVWVLAFPWQVPLGTGELAAVGTHLQAGGTVVVAYSEPPSRQDERDVLAYLGLERRTVRGPAPLGPLAWWSYQREAWELTPGDGWSEGARAPELVMSAIRNVPRAPAGASVLYFRRLSGGDAVDEDVPLVFTYRRHAGRVAVLPAAVLSNAYLLEAGHADFLESLRLAAGGAWRFDEYHHGLVDAGLEKETGATFAWDLFMLHLAVFYVLGLLAVARRFGPAWREAAVTAGSTSSFLRNLGALHRRLRHHQAAARLLAVRSRELDPSLPETRPPAVSKDAELVAFGRRMTLLSRRPTND